MSFFQIGILKIVSTGVHRIDNKKNLIVLRTFSMKDRFHLKVSGSFNNGGIQER